MKTNEYSLQILHHEEIFASREQALTYIADFYRPNSLDCEPFIVKYGEARNPNVILAFGTSSNAPGSYYVIDMTKANEEIASLTESIQTDEEELSTISELLNGVINATGLVVDEHRTDNKVIYDVDTRDEVIGTAVNIAQAVDLLSKYAQQTHSDSQLSVEDTKSIRLIYEVNPEGGMLLKAEIKVSTTDDDDLDFNNNIVGVKSDGVYASAHLMFDEVRNELIFTTSGYKNGRFQDDAIVQRINIGQHTKLVADNDGHTVRLVINENPTTYTTTLSADVQISSAEDNILEVRDGKLAVLGRAKNIKYGDSNVADALTAQSTRIAEVNTKAESALTSAHIEGGQTDTLNTTVTPLSDGGAQVTGSVRLGSTNSIVVRNGGLEANITVDVNQAANQLIVTIGNQTITKTLPGVELFESAEYDDANEQLIITFRTGNKIYIPIHSIIHTWDVVNPTDSAITLTKTTVSGGTDTLSSDVKLRSTDNLLAKENGYLYVSESNINSKVAVETQRATTAENAITTDVNTFKTEVNNRFNTQTEAIDDVADSVVTERERATGAEHAISETANTASATATEAKTLVTELGTTVGTLSTDLTETETKLDALTTTVNNNKAEANTKFAELTTDVNANTTAITNLTESLSTEVTNRTNKDTELDGKIELVKSSLTVESNRAQAAEARIEHSISDALQEAKTYTDQSINAVETEISNLTDEVNENKFKTKDTNTVHLTLDKQTGEDEKTLTADVKIKTIEGLESANIIKSDTNGIYATVNLTYNKAENKLTFNDGNGDKVFELNNFGILQDGYYDSENKKIVLIVKKDDQTTDTIEIPVGDLVDTWTVENPSDSPIRLTKTTVAGEGDVLTADIIVQDTIDSPVTLTKAGGVLSSNLRILDNEHNLLIKENGALFADNDANAHFTNFRGSTTNVTNAIQTIDGDVVNALNNANDALEKANQALEEVGEFDGRIDEALEKSNQALNAATQALDTANQALELASGFDARITAIEEWISKAIDLGTYTNEQNGGGE